MERVMPEQPTRSLLPSRPHPEEPAPPASRRMATHAAACCHPSRRAQERAPQDEVLLWCRGPASSGKVGWVERSETHHRPWTRHAMGFARALPILHSAGAPRSNLNARASAAAGYWDRGPYPDSGRGARPTRSRSARRPRRVRCRGRALAVARCHSRSFAGIFVA
jgi:hypothetical protein